MSFSVCEAGIRIPRRLLGANDRPIRIRSGRQRTVTRTTLAGTRCARSALHADTAKVLLTARDQQRDYAAIEPGRGSDSSSLTVRSGCRASSRTVAQPILRR